MKSNPKYKRITKNVNDLIISMFKDGFSTKEISQKTGYSIVTILIRIKKNGFYPKSQSELQRKYSVKEDFFDVIDTEEKAYFLGLLYADGYNNTDRNSVNLSLKESDKDILIKLNNLIQSDKPLQYVDISNQKKTEGFENSQNQYRLVIANKHISNQLVKLGCGKAKTHKLVFPEWLDDIFIKHFIRGYWDGDGWIGKRSMSIVGTEQFCSFISNFLKENFGLNSYLRSRHPERKNNIRMLEISGKNKMCVLLRWLYDKSNIYLDRKYNKAMQLISAPILKRSAAINLANYCPTPKVGESYVCGDDKVHAEK